MSGVPTKSAVSSLLIELRAINNYDAEIAEIEKLLPRLKQLKEWRANAVGNVLKRLREMDVDQTGNYGWEGRMLTLLRLLTTGATP